MTIKLAKRGRLEKAGWTVGDTSSFLSLTPDEEAILDLKLSLGQELRSRRHSRNWTQAEFAKRIRSSQSRVAKMESGDPSVSFDLMIRSLLATGATRTDLAGVFHGR